MQLIALEQLCMLLLMSDNVDRCFESCPPRTFLPALCRIFLDEEAPDQVLEVTARAITYYLDVSAECTRRIVAVEGAIKAMCNRQEIFLKAFEELRIVLIMVGIAVLTFSTLLFFAEKDSEQFDWTWSEVLLWGIVTLSTGK